MSAILTVSNLTAFTFSYPKAMKISQDLVSTNYRFKKVGTGLLFIS